MVKKVNLVLTLALAFVFLVGCNEEEHTTNSGIGVMIIEDFEVHSLDIPPYFQSSCWRWGDSLKVLNGLTGEVENIIEFNEYQQLNWCFLQPYRDYYIMSVSLFDSQIEDLAQQIAVEYFIFDQDFKLVEEFTIFGDDNDVMSKMGLPNLPTVGQNSAGEWLVYGIGWSGSHIYAYNFNTQETFQIAHLNGVIEEIYMISDANKLAFTLMYDFMHGWQERIEIGFIDLDMHEIIMRHEVENVMLSHSNQSEPLTLMSEVLLLNLTTGSENQPERKALMIHPLTDEVRIFPIREDDFSWRGDESYYRWISDASITFDGNWLLIQANEFSEELVEGWCGSNMTSTVRLYDTLTTELIFEHLLIDENSLNLGERLSSDASIIQLEENTYLIRQSIGTGITEESFEPTGIRFEYIIIEIVVHDDE